jgi:hypothetical protein
MSISRTADVFYTYRFVRILTTKWEDMDAYEYGIIDENGKVLRKSSELKTPDEKDSYTVFHRLVFNIKRLLEKLPFGRSQLSSYAAALFLIKEETGMSEEQVEDLMKAVFDDLDIDCKYNIEEAYYSCEGELNPGVYRLREDVAIPSTGEVLAFAGTEVTVSGNTFCESTILNHEIYKVTHNNTKQEIYVTAQDLIK